MGKPTFTVFVGVDEEGLTSEDVAKLPLEVKKSYRLSPHWNGHKVIFKGIEFSSFDFGQKNTDDPGDFAGFGVSVLGQWFDSGTSRCDVNRVLMTVEVIQARLEDLFERWGLVAKPKVLSFCSYGP